MSNIIYGINATVGIHLWPVKPSGWNQTVALNKANRAHFWPQWFVERSKHASAWWASEERWSRASSPSLSHWLQAQRAGHRNGWACCRFSAAQMARAVSGPTDIMGGTLTSGHDSIRQVSFAAAPSPQTPVDSVEKWRGGDTGARPSVCISVLVLVSFAEPSLILAAGGCK